ncbi:GNAT family N-acetyltransferase [Hwanghaeella grinnelliae]|uniref:GNAT family N-acetyltransferase n=1 Tax=Hwanghaeella grinnelliae TaxID=2500179 RepID=A0A437QJK1_9PROT|nr:GNAT family N-acetyltransferase [Hwanghaeella grinnelliae]RVU34672.1 GNAT family N-acetyltransferase [Hwanghaeella grinnelliae]
MAGAVSIAEESPNQPAVIALLKAGDAYAASLYPAESNHGSDLDELLQPHVTFLVARLDETVVGTGAFVEKGGYAEMKRVFVADTARGLKLGNKLLQAIEQKVAAKGLTILRLETGIRQPEALGLYRRAGYVEIAPFGDYDPDPLSVFMEKTLEREGAGL